MKGTRNEIPNTLFFECSHASAGNKGYRIALQQYVEEERTFVDFLKMKLKTQSEWTSEKSKSILGTAIEIDFRDHSSIQCNYPLLLLGGLYYGDKNSILEKNHELW